MYPSFFTSLGTEAFYVNGLSLFDLALNAIRIQCGGMIATFPAYILADAYTTLHDIAENFAIIHFGTVMRVYFLIWGAILHVCTVSRVHSGPVVQGGRACRANWSRARR